MLHRPRRVFICIIHVLEPHQEHIDWRPLVIKHGNCHMLSYSVWTDEERLTRFNQNNYLQYPNGKGRSGRERKTGKHLSCRISAWDKDKWYKWPQENVLLFFVCLTVLERKVKDPRWMAAVGEKGE